MSKRISRRDLLKQTAAAAAVFTIVPRHVLGGQGYTPPSEELTKAVIGVGGMGKGHLGLGPERLLAICDVDSEHIREALEICAASGKKDVQTYSDFREVLQRPDIDVVHIASPPHWHGLMYVAAAQAGKDIWGEKPMTRTIGEGRKVVDAIQKHGRIFRVNTRFRFESDIPDVGIRATPLKKVIENGLLGWPLRFTISTANGFPWKLSMWEGRTNLVPQPVPANLNYDMWLGPAPIKPYHPHRVHQSFRGYWDYDGGGLGDQGQHFVDPVQYLLGKDDTSPVEIEADGPEQHPDAAKPWNKVWLKYADGCEIILDGPGNEPDPPFVEGPKGKIYKNFRSTIPDLQKKLASLPDPAPQQTDFIDCIKTRKKFCINESVAHRSCTLINLSKIAIRLRRPLRYDPDKQLFINDEAANRMINEPMRAPWVI